MKFTLSASILALALSATGVAAAPGIELTYTVGTNIGITYVSKTVLIHNSGERTGYPAIDSDCKTVGSVELCVDKYNKRAHAYYRDSNYKRCFRNYGSSCGTRCYRSESTLALCARRIDHFSPAKKTAALRSGLLPTLSCSRAVPFGSCLWEIFQLSAKKRSQSSEKRKLQGNVPDGATVDDAIIQPSRAVSPSVHRNRGFASEENDTRTQHRLSRLINSTAKLSRSSSRSTPSSDIPLCSTDKSNQHAQAEQN
ncbi:hypothetical protein OPT61_g2169 [Boeremia exigua]|uniref:Uncharacterized protein n=1 Tax=Boeremia exigua TaxID=749465 RepID=A0ACC2IMG1_9PLEO|nr:hypothetical protein OPT61_g2169 [Boeremia exigua]